MNVYVEKTQRNALMEMTANVTKNVPVKKIPFAVVGDVAKAKIMK